MTDRRRQPQRLVSRAVDFRASETNDEPGDGRTLDGYAAVFDTPTEINSWEGAFTEKIAHGAFRKTLRERTPVLQFDHGRDVRTGSVPIGAFQTLEEDATGLHVVARLFDNPVVEPIRQAIEGKAITGMSFRFEVLRDEWRDADDKIVKGDALMDRLWANTDPSQLVRTVKEVKLFEVGPVVFPAYEASSVGVRSILANLDEDDRERLVAELRDSLRNEPGQEHDGSVKSEYDRAREQADEPSSPEPEPSPGPEPTPEPSAAPQRARTNTTPKEGKSTMGPQDDTRMTVEERAARQDEIRSRLQEIDQEFNGSELPEEVETEWRSLLDEDDQHTRAIQAAEERRAALEQRVERGETGRERPSQYAPRRTGVRKAENIYDLAAIRNEARSMDELGGLYRDHALRAVEAARFPGVEDRSAAQAQVEKLLTSVDDENGTLARRILATGSPVYDRAFGKVVKSLSTMGLTTEESRALTVGTDASGGFAVPFQLDPTVILTGGGYINPLRRLARVVQITGKEWQGITSAGITVSRDAEAEEVSDDSPTFAQPTVRPTRVQGFVPFSIEIDQDWASLRSEITSMLADAKEEEEASSFILGDGTGLEPGGLVGSMDAGSVVNVGASLTSSDLYDLEESLPPRFRARAAWMANRSVFNTVRQLGSATDGGDLWVRLGQGLPPELIGYPAYEVSTMATDMTTVGSRYLVFGDFSKFLIVDRVGMSIELVPHLFGANRRPTGQRGIYAIWRNNSKVLVPGAFRVAAASV